MKTSLADLFGDALQTLHDLAVNPEVSEEVRLLAAARVTDAWESLHDPDCVPYLPEEWAPNA